MQDVDDVEQYGQVKQIFKRTYMVSLSDTTYKARMSMEEYLPLKGLEAKEGEG